MATNNRGGAGRGRNTVAKPKSAPIRSTSARTSPNSGSFLSTVRERPFAAAAIVAGAAGASAFLWAKRAQLTEQVCNLSEAIGERFSGSDASEPSGMDPASEFKAQKMSPPSSAGKRRRKASATDPMMEEQSATGAISY